MLNLESKIVNAEVLFYYPNIFSETYFLSEDQQKLINEMSDKCYKLLKDTFPKGHHFSEFVKVTLF